MNASIENKNPAVLYTHGDMWRLAEEHVEEGRDERGVETIDGRETRQQRVRNTCVERDKYARNEKRRQRKEHEPLKHTCIMAYTVIQVSYTLRDGHDADGESRDEIRHPVFAPLVERQPGDDGCKVAQLADMELGHRAPDLAQRNMRAHNLLVAVNEAANE